MLHHQFKSQQLRFKAPAVVGCKGCQQVLVLLAIRTAHWLSEKSGRTISHQGLSNIWRRHRKSERQKTLDKSNRKRKPKTSKEKAEARLKRKIADTKRVRTMTEKKLAQLEEKAITMQEAPSKIREIKSLRSAQEVFKNKVEAKTEINKSAISFFILLPTGHYIKRVRLPIAIGIAGSPVLLFFN